MPLYFLPAGFLQQSLLLFDSVAFGGQSHSGSDSEQVMKGTDKGCLGGCTWVIPVCVLPGRSEPRLPYRSLGSASNIKNTNFICCLFCNFCFLLKEGTGFAICYDQIDGEQGV